MSPYTSATLVILAIVALHAWAHWLRHLEIMASHHHDDTEHPTPGIR